MWLESILISLLQLVVVALMCYPTHMCRFSLAKIRTRGRHKISSSSEKYCVRQFARSDVRKRGNFIIEFHHASFLTRRKQRSDTRSAVTSYRTAWAHANDQSIRTRRRTQIPRSRVVTWHACLNSFFLNSAMTVCTTVCLPGVHFSPFWINYIYTRI